jgi:hypothetical protein
MSQDRGGLQLAEAGPDDLDANAEQKGRQPLPLSVVSRQGEENWSVADRINNREQAGVNQKNTCVKCFTNPVMALVASAGPHDAGKGRGSLLQSDRQAEL